MHRQILVAVDKPILCFASESRYLSCAYHLARIVGCPLMLWLSCFLKHLLRLEKHDLSFRDNVLVLDWNSS